MREHELRKRIKREKMQEQMPESTRKRMDDLLDGLPEETKRSKIHRIWKNAPIKSFCHTKLLLPLTVWILVTCATAKPSLNMTKGFALILGNPVFSFISIFVSSLSSEVEVSKRLVSWQITGKSRKTNAKLKNIFFIFSALF